MFLALLGMCETNALKAYRHTVGPMQRYEWLWVLSEKLINNPYLEVEESSGEDDEAGPSGEDACGNQVYFEHHFQCSVCKSSTHWKCGCGYPCCRAGVPGKAPLKSAPKCDAYFRHVRGGM